MIKEKINVLVARLSARVFLGEELCRNPAWLKIAVSHIFTGFIAAFCLRLFPPFLRPLAHWLIPHCRRLRAQVREARELVRKTIEKRQIERDEAISQGKQPKEYHDGIEWCQTLANKYDFDVVDMQLGLSIASVHNTTDLITQVLYDLAAHPEMVGRLRQEFIEVIGKGGWNKAALYNLKLLDSVIKESQRLKPISVCKIELERLPFFSLTSRLTVRSGYEARGYLHGRPFGRYNTPQRHHNRCLSAQDVGLECLP